MKQVSVLSIDVGFDLLLHGQAVLLPDSDDGQYCLRYHPTGSTMETQEITGDLASVSRALQAAGYQVEVPQADVEEYQISRDGDTPLTFRGEEIATANSHADEGGNRNRWHEVTVYRTEGGRYVVGIEYHTQWRGEQDRHDAVALGPDLAEVAECLRTTIPIPDGIGYPPKPQYADRQARMKASLRTRWEVMVGELLEVIGAAERIE